MVQLSQLHSMDAVYEVRLATATIIIMSTMLESLLLSPSSAALKLSVIA